MNNSGYFGEFGGSFAPETLIAPLTELESAYTSLSRDQSFQKELHETLKHFVGRPTPLYEAKQLSRHYGGARILLKREDLAHTGAHKINNTVAQGLLAKHMGKTRLIAETGAGQHGVATATVASRLDLACVIYMGAKDMARQAPNVLRMQILGADVRPVTQGSQTLKDATSEAMRDWVEHVHDSYYLIGSALGPHPYPTIVRDFQTIIGREARSQVLEYAGRLPNQLIACVGGGSNAIGLFTPFLEDDVSMVGVEAGGKSLTPGQHAARFSGGAPGVLQGSKSYVLQDEGGNTLATHSISAGLDYPSVGPEHAHLNTLERVRYTHAYDDEVLKAALTLAKTEGIIPALESAHALAHVEKIAPTLSKKDILLVGLSGRGDKDIHTFAHYLEEDSHALMF